MAIKQEDGPPSSDEEREARIHLKTFLVVFSVCIIYVAQVYNVVGAGAVRSSSSIWRSPPFSHSSLSNTIQLKMDVAAVVGFPGDSVCLAASIAILTMVASPPVSQAADYWGGK